MFLKGDTGVTIQNDPTYLFIQWDNECAKTSILKKSRIFITNDSIRFSDHQENWLPESRLISGILRDLDER